MILSLVKKELRDQRPFVALGIFLVGLELLFAIINHDLDQTPVFALVDDAFSTASRVFLLIIAFALATGLLTRERDEGTLEFLDALPIGRVQLFGTKVAVAWSVLMVYPAGVAALVLLRHALTRSSLDPIWHVELLARGLLLEGVVVLVALALGLLLSFVGRTSWLVIGVLAVALTVLERRVPALWIFDPLALSEPKFDGPTWRMPWKALAVQLPIAAALMGAALLLFTGTWDRALRKLGRWIAGPAAAPVTFAAVVACIAAIGLWSTDSSDGGTSGEKLEGATFPESALGHFDSSRYAFTYPANLSQRAQPLLDSADEVNQRVRDVLGAPAGALIPVDMTGSGEHTSGQAFWNEIRIDLRADREPDELRAILAHETTHVLAARIVGPDRQDRLGEMRSLSEGLASWVEHRLYPEPGAQEANRFVTAAAHARRQIQVHDAIDAEKLEAKQDANLVYPLGELLVQAMADRYGAGAPRRLLDALGRRDAPEKLEGIDLWQDTFLAAGFDLQRLFDDVDKVLRKEEAQRRAEIDDLPRPAPAAERTEDGVQVRGVLAEPIPEGWSLVARFRASEDTDWMEYDGPYTADPEDPTFLRDESDIRHGEVWIQLGLRSPAGPVLYEPWVAVPVN